MKRLLIAGDGDIARRARPALESRFEIRALSRAQGANLDLPESLGALAAADAVLHCVPPPATGATDTRTENLLIALESTRILPTRFVYISTSGVYGDCGGALVDESRAPNPQSARALRRADAEAQLALWCKSRGTALVILRAPGIYAAERLPLARLRAGTPVLREADDVYTNHIHADDLARIVIAALSRARAGRAYNASDDSWMKMGDYFDLVADSFGLPHPPRITWEAAQEVIPENMLSFMRESRRLANNRLKKELRVNLRYPSVAQGVSAARART